MDMVRSSFEFVAAVRGAVNGLVRWSCRGRVSRVSHRAPSHAESLDVRSFSRLRVLLSAAIVSAISTCWGAIDLLAEEGLWREWAQIRAT